MIFGAYLCMGAFYGKPKPKTYLYKISHPRAKHVSYLFGGMHLYEGDLFSYDKVKKIIKDIRQVATEINYDDPAIKKQLFWLQNQFIQMYESMESKPKYLQKLYLHYKEKIKSDSREFIVLSSECLVLEGSVQYMEENIYELTKGIKKRGLETIEEQALLPFEQSNKECFNYFLSNSLIMQLLSYELYPTNRGLVKQNWLALNKAYRTYSLEKYLTQPATYCLRINMAQRNKKWIPKMTEMMQEDATLFVVGALHLYGSDGLITLLRQAGYKVLPVL